MGWDREMHLINNSGRYIWNIYSFPFERRETRNDGPGSVGTSGVETYFFTKDRWIRIYPDGLVCLKFIPLKNKKGRRPKPGEYYVSVEL